MKHRIIALGITLLPLVAGALEPMVVADNGATPKRFIALDKARGIGSALPPGAAGAVPARGKSDARAPFVLRTDAAQMNKGFMRIDRAQSAPVPAQHTVAAKNEKALPPVHRPPQVVHVDAAMAATDEEEVAGNRDTVDPVLALFDPASGGALTSFRDAMSGRASSSVTGLGRHGWPVAMGANQKFTSGFGMRADPFNGHQAFHGGIDIAAPVGTAVLASADGEVMQVETDARYGKYIGIQHADGTLSRYGHLSMQDVRVGQRVRGGQRIGAVGATGRATGAHLDYRISKNGMKFDPLAVLAVPSTMAMNTAQPTVSSAPGQRPVKVMQAAMSHPLVIKVR
ncbi:MAG: M23 family metallopeptidase [Pseudomonadota bacterium]